MVGKNYSVLPPNIHPAKICSHVVDATTTFTRNLYQVVLLEYHHYQTRLLCRVPRTLSKGRKTLSKVVAECSTRRSAHGLSSTGDASFAECHFSGTRQSVVVCQVALGKQVSTGRYSGQRDGRMARNGQNGTGKTGWERGTLPSALRKALGEVRSSNFAECCQVGTRRSLNLCRVPRVWHSAKLRTSPSVYVIALGKSFFQKIEKWLLCRVSR